MIKFKSEKIFLEKKSEDIFNKIIDLRNFKELIPLKLKILFAIKTIAASIICIFQK